MSVNKLGSQVESTNGPMRTLPIEICDLCGATGSRKLGGLTDVLFGADGEYAIFECSNPACGTLWVNPRPLEADIHLAYKSYYTHSTRAKASRSLPHRAANLLLNGVRNAIQLSDERTGIQTLFLEGHPVGSVLDVGCGNGDRLVVLRTAGWDVHGQDIDPSAVKYAREERGLPVELGPLEEIAFPADSFDVILMNHVVEHLYNIRETLAECHRILRPSGMLVAITPNARAFGLKHFGKAWRGLEPPRHIRLFTTDSLGQLARDAGFAKVHSSTSAAQADNMARGSYRVQKGRGGASAVSTQENVKALFFQWQALQHFKRDPDSGEVLVLRAYK